MRVVGMIGIAMVSMGSPALAHAFLERAQPPVGSEMAAPPHQIVLTFTEGVEPLFSTVELHDPKGAAVPTEKTATASSTAHTEATAAVVSPRRLPASQVESTATRVAPGTSPRRILPQAHDTVHTASRMKPGSTIGTRRRLAHGWSGAMAGRHSTVTLTHRAISSGSPANKSGHQVSRSKGSNPASASLRIFRARASPRSRPLVDARYQDGLGPVEVLGLSQEEELMVNRLDCVS